MSERCVMSRGDFILGSTVLSLPESEWNTFRDYMRSCSHRISPHYGCYCKPDYERHIIFDSCDSVWSNFGVSGKMIDKQSSLKAIEQFTGSKPSDVELTKLEDEIAQAKAVVEQLEKQYEEAKNRQSAIIGIALKIISEAMCNPNVPVRFADWHTDKVSNTQLCEVIAGLIDKLELRQLRLNSDKCILFHVPAK